jgi:hypothetical protein
MLKAGGYWRPLAAVARLLEELGELVELLESSKPSKAALASELADLWIITTALADQFLGTVAEPTTRTGVGQTSRVSGGEAIVAAGEIARVANYYDGPKTPRSTDEMPSLHGAIRRFHEKLDTLAGSLGVQLARAVEEKLEVIHKRDMTRFEREDSDPSTAPSLDLLRSSPALAGNPALEMRLWGAPGQYSQSVDEIAAAALPSLLSFAKAAVAEDLEGYVIAGPAVGDPPKPHWLPALLSMLEAGGRARLDSAETKIEINGLSLEVRVLPAGFVLLCRGAA